MVFQNSICKINVIPKPTWIVNDSSIWFDIALAYLIWLILSKSDAKLLKQQLFNVLWQYLGIGALMWNFISSTFLALPIGTTNILNVFLSYISSCLWKKFFNPIKFNIKPMLWYCILTLEIEFTFILFLFSSLVFKPFLKKHVHLCI